MSNDMEILCVACKCNPNDDIYDKSIEELPKRGTKEFGDIAKEFRIRHKHSTCIVRRKKKERKENELKLRNENNNRGNTKNVSSS